MKKLLFVLPILAVATLVLSGCTENSIQCTQEQKSAEICTMDYTPVCGNDDVTYGNACGACTAEGVDSYTKGECADVEKTCGGTGDICKIPAE